MLGYGDSRRILILKRYYRTLAEKSEARSLKVEELPSTMFSDQYPHKRALTHISGAPLSFTVVFKTQPFTVRTLQFSIWLLPPFRFS
jgi:hypothetical protein